MTVVSTYLKIALCFLALLLIIPRTLASDTEYAARSARNTDLMLVAAEKITPRSNAEYYTIKRRICANGVVYNQTLLESLLHNHSTVEILGMDLYTVLRWTARTDPAGSLHIALMVQAIADAILLGDGHSVGNGYQPKGPTEMESLRKQARVTRTAMKRLYDFVCWRETADNTAVLYDKPFEALQYGGRVYLCRVLDTQRDMLDSRTFAESGAVTLKVIKTMLGPDTGVIQVPYCVMTGFVKSDFMPPNWPASPRDAGNKLVLCIIVPGGNDPGAEQLPGMAGAVSRAYFVDSENAPEVQKLQRMIDLYLMPNPATRKQQIAAAMKDPDPDIKAFATAFQPICEQWFWNEDL